MRNPISLFACITFLSVTGVQGQASMTFTTGISPQQTPGSHYIFINRSSPKDEFTFDLAQVKASYFVGAGVRYDVKPFFVSGEAQYNKREYVYNVAYTYAGFGRTEENVQYAESMNVINLPLSVGVDLGIFDVMSGFLPQVIVSQQTELDKLKGFEKKLNAMRFGWHSGIAANIENLRIGINWQMDFNNYADHLYIRDQSLGLSGRSNRVMGSLSYQF